MENRAERIKRVCDMINRMNSEQFGRLLAEIAAMEAEKRAGQGSTSAATENG